MSALLLGFLIGMRHALDADHVSAVATLLFQRDSNAPNGLRQSVAWGLGHTLTLLLFALVVMASGQGISEGLARGLELAVGVMLVLLGFDVIRRLKKRRIHFHAHSHEGGELHLHAHAHTQSPGHHHRSQAHRHTHVKRIPMRALLVGMMHGMAGSAALLVLMVGVADSWWTGVLYVLLFGLGTLVGMAALTAVIVLPLRISARHLPVRYFDRLYAVLQLSIGCISVGLGAMVIYQQGGW